MKYSDKRKRAKEILGKMFRNSFDWMNDEDLTDGLTESEITEVNEMVEAYITSICKRYKI